MWHNYWITAYRSLKRRPLFTAINVGGLAVGCACCILLALFVVHELRYDRYHTDVERISRVTTTEAQPSGTVETFGRTAYPLADALQSEAVFDAVARLQPKTLPILKGDAMEAREAGWGEASEAEVYFADPQAPDVFTMPVVRGDLAETLQAPDRVALTEAEALRLFGTDDALGRTVTVDFDDQGRTTYTVGAVVETPPSNSTLAYDVLLPMEALSQTFNPRFWTYLSQSWTSGIAMTFVKTVPEASPSDVQAALDRIARERFTEENEPDRALGLQALTDMRLSPEITSAFPTRDPSTLYVLGALVFLVLTVACVNFVTLTLGQSAGRTHEVGIRKALGAQVGQVRTQFWGEALLTIGVAAAVGVVLARLGVPTFNRLAETDLTLNVLQSPEAWAIVAGVVAVVGLLAGAYPAVRLARMAPTGILRGGTTLGIGQRMSRVLMTLQFALSIGFVAGALVIGQQTDFMQTKDPGFVTDRVVTVSASNTSPDQSDEDQVTLGGGSVYQRFQQEARQLSSVDAVTASLAPVGTDDNGIGVTLVAPQGSVPATVNVVDTNFVEAMGLTLQVGRTFAEGATENRVIVNQTLVEAMGWDDPIGRTPEFEGHFGSIMKDATVVGVVEDFHYRTLHHAIEPLILTTGSGISGTSMHVAVRLAPGPMEASLAQVADVWGRVAPDTPFDYTFLEDRIERQYAEERRWQQITTFASLAALLIACAGLFGLATLATKRREREIGIRKALGSTVGGILTLVSKDFLMLVGIAFVVAAPPAYVILSEWLSTFPYRIDLTGLWFVAAGLVVLTVASVAVGTQAYRAAQMDPVETLRSES